MLGETSSPNVSSSNQAQTAAWLVAGCPGTQAARPPSRPGLVCSASRKCWSKALIEAAAEAPVSFPPMKRMACGADPPGTVEPFSYTADTT